MTIVGAFDLHRAQLTFEYLDQREVIFTCGYSLTTELAKVILGVRRTAGRPPFLPTTEEREAGAVAESRRVASAALEADHDGLL